jgi:CBS-domain-containing membrane protein
MSDQLVTISADTSTKEAIQKMAAHQIRRLPVVDGKKLIGMVSLGDFAIEELTDDQAGKALSEISEQENFIQ